MQVALICEKCGKVHTEDTDGAHLVIDFREKYMSFICQNKSCNADNKFSFDTWIDNNKKSPLPQTKIMR